MPDSAMPQWPTWLAMFVLALVAFLPSALGAELLQFDDNFFFGPDNPEFRAGAWAVATTPIANAYLPVAHLSLWLDYAFTGQAPLWPHLHALLLHALAAVVLVRLMLQLGVGRLAAHTVGALFLVHPALCESVAWVSGRKDVLSGLFVFLALHQTVRLTQRPGWGRGLVTVLLAVAAMYSKPTAVVLPLLAAGLVFWRGGARSGWLATLAMLIVTIAIALQHQALAAAEGTLAGGSFGDRLQQVPGAFWHYLSTALWPVELNVLYPEVDTLARFGADWLLGAIALTAFGATAAVAWRSAAWRPFAFGLIAFVIALLPFNTAYPASSIAAADRYLYLALPWLALAAVALLSRLSTLASLPAVGALLSVLLLVPLLWSTIGRARAFADDESLWRSSLVVEQENAVAHLNLVFDRMRRRAFDVETTLPHLEAAVRAARYPIHELRARTLLRQLAMASADYETAARHAHAEVAAARAQLACESSPRRIELARELLLRAHIESFNAFHYAGQEQAAEDSLAAAQALAPDRPAVIAFGVRRELAARRDELMALAAAGKAPRLADDDAAGAAVDLKLAAARQRCPDDADLWLAQAEWDRVRDRVLPALRAYREAQRLRPSEVDAWLGAARMLRERGSYEDAVQHARNGLQHRPDPRLRQELALALVGQNRFDEAELHLEAYLRLRPEDRDSARILANLLIGRAYTRLSDQNARDDVRRLVERALAYNPDEPKAQLVLGRLAREQRRFAAAVRHLEAAYRAMPTLEEARRQYTDSLAALGYERLLQRDHEAATDSWLRCLEVAPKDFDGEGIREQLRLAWQRLEARGVERLAGGDRKGAIADFRRCLRIDPEQHWAAWLLATALYGEPEVDLDELEQLCRQAVAWQQQHELDASRQVYLLATTLFKKGDVPSARAVAADYLEAPAADAEPQVLAALKQLAAN